jgi:hypothetical protein
MQSASTGDLGYDELATLIVEAVGASSLGQTGGDALEAAFTARGVLPQCTRVLEFEGTPLQGPAELSNIWIAPGTNTTGISALGWTPGVVQMHSSLPENTGTVTIELTKVAFSGGGGGFGQPGTPFEPKVLVRFGADPITFTYGPFAPADGVLTLDATKAGSKYTAIADAPPGATSVYVMVASSGEDDGGYTDVTITSTQGAPDPTTGATTGAGATTSTGSGEPKADEQDIGGCGCEIPGSRSAPVGGALAGLLLALGASLRRRRR